MTNTYENEHYKFEVKFGDVTTEVFGERHAMYEIAYADITVNGKVFSITMNIDSDTWDVCDDNIDFGTRQLIRNFDGIEDVGVIEHIQNYFSAAACPQNMREFLMENDLNVDNDNSLNHLIVKLNGKNLAIYYTAHELYIDVQNGLYHLFHIFDYSFNELLINASDNEHYENFIFEGIKELIRHKTGLDIGPTEIMDRFENNSDESFTMTEIDQLHALIENKWIFSDEYKQRLVEMTHELFKVGGNQPNTNMNEYSL